MSNEPLLVTTTLGSCVAVCFFDPASVCGAICHGALPNAPVCIQKEPFRYMDEAIHYILERYRRLGVPWDRLKIKVFGGADVLGAAPREGYRTVGRQNIMATVETLGWLGLRPAVRHTGGRHGRKLMFVTHTGEVYVRSLVRQEQERPSE